MNKIFALSTLVLLTASSSAASMSLVRLRGGARSGAEAAAAPIARGRPSRKHPVLLAAGGGSSAPRASMSPAARARATSKPAPLAAAAADAPRPSFYWAVLANWLYFLALGLSIPVLPRVVSSIVNADGSPDVSPASAVLSGDIEALDKALTFLGVGLLGALSDVLGRKALMGYSALGFAATCLLQASAQRSTALLYLADLVDGASSCMNTVCQVCAWHARACTPCSIHVCIQRTHACAQSYVMDASTPETRAGNLGVFQGLSVAGAFVLGLPISGLLAAQYGHRVPLYAAAAVGVLNGLICLLVTPESLPPSARQHKKLNLAQARALPTPHAHAHAHAHVSTCACHARAHGTCQWSRVLIACACAWHVHVPRPIRWARCACSSASLRRCAPPRAPSRCSGSPTRASTPCSETTSTTSLGGGRSSLDPSCCSSASCWGWRRGRSSRASGLGAP